MKDNKKIILKEEDKSLMYGTPEFAKEVGIALKTLRKGKATIVQAISDDGSFEELDTDDTLQLAIFKYIQERLPINAFCVWVKGCIRIAKAIALPRCKEPVETRCEEQMVFADKLETADVEQKLYDYYKSRIPSEKGTDGIVRPDFESEEWKDFADFRSVLFERFGLKEIHEKYLGMCINKMKSIHELISLTNELEFDKSEIKGDWTSYEMAVNAVFSLLPKQVYQLIVYYKESVKAAFLKDMQDRGKSQGTRNAWMSMGNRYTSEYHSYEQGYKFSDLDDVEKMNWLIANSFLTIFNRIYGGFSSVDELINDNIKGYTFRPDVRYNIPRAMQEIRDRIEEGTQIHRNYYFNHEVIGGDNKTLTMKTIYYATYPTIVKELGFAPGEYGEMLGLSVSELKECRDMFKSLEASQEKVTDMLRNYEIYDVVESFVGDFKCLSEFAVIKGGRISDSCGIEYESIGDYFMASKTDDINIRRDVAKKHCRICKQTMENIEIRKGWDPEIVMLQAIAKRAAIDNEFRLVLKASDGISFMNSFGGREDKDVDGYGFCLCKFRKSLIEQSKETEALIAQKRREAALAAIAAKEAAGASKKQ